MEMTYESFVETLRTNLLEATGYDELFVRLLNIEKNQMELQECIYRTIGDIALVLYARMGELNGSSASVKIKRHMLEKWNQDPQQVFEEALLNTYFISPPRIYCWEKLIFDPDYTGENFMNLLCDYKIKKDVLGNCLSTTIFLPGVAERIGQLMGCGFYMVFTSIHEVMIHSEKTAVPEDLKHVLEDTVRETTPPEDFLTYQVYHYDLETGAFSFF